MSYHQPALNTRVTGRRVVATIIDGVVLSLLLGAVGKIFHIDVPTDGSALTELSFDGSLVTAVIVLLYYIVLEGFFGRTAGKLATGIRVIGEDGGRPGFVSGLVRTLLRLIDGFFGYLLALIIVVNSDRRRRLGDMAAKTLVVRA
ncbi:RDD family protein [Actinoplanes sp. TFC3]|uniref:RDD family protein n=1 Tax=Actinoplanes sp. TFC3 TaxID=1710355 RepID=UPI00082EF944|nr:RDD family protein [Actinoplanes sp. TFC3]